MAHISVVRDAPVGTSWWWSADKDSTAGTTTNHNTHMMSMRVGGVCILLHN